MIAKSEMIKDCSKGFSLVEIIIAIAIIGILVSIAISVYRKFAKRRPHTEKI